MVKKEECPIDALRKELGRLRYWVEFSVWGLLATWFLMVLAVVVKW